MKKILVATDGSETSNRALKKTKILAEYMDAEVTIINVASDLVAHPYLMNREYGIKTNEDLRLMSKELLDESLKYFEGFEGKVKAIVRSGDAGREIIEEVEEGDYDLVVIGSRGLGAFSRLMVGSVSNKVLNHVAVDVWVIK